MKKIITILKTVLATAIVFVMAQGCTPLPSGGPISNNIMYNYYGKSIPFTSSNMQPANNLYFDLNNDGNNDISITYQWNSVVWEFYINTLNANIEICGENGKIRAFKTNEIISPQLMFGQGTSKILQFCAFIEAQFIYNQYFLIENSPFEDIKKVGFRIKNGNNYNYGWFSLNYTDNSPVIKQLNIIESALNKNTDEQILAGAK